jgi:uncharacterized coiled-coil DUF342 family protein
MTENAEDRGDRYKRDAERVMSNAEDTVTDLFDECVGEIIELIQEVDAYQEEVEERETDIKELNKKLNANYPSTVVHSLERVQALIANEIKMLKAVYEIKNTDPDVGDGAESNVTSVHLGIPESGAG